MKGSPVRVRASASLYERGLRLSPECLLARASSLLRQVRTDYRTAGLAPKRGARGSRSTASAPPRSPSTRHADSRCLRRRRSWGRRTQALLGSTTPACSTAPTWKPASAPFKPPSARCSSRIECDCPRELDLPVKACCHNRPAQAARCAAEDPRSVDDDVGDRQGERGAEWPLASADAGAREVGHRLLEDDRALLEVDLPHAAGLAADADSDLSGRMTEGDDFTASAVEGDMDVRARGAAGSACF